MDDSVGYVPLPINNLDESDNSESVPTPSPPPKQRRKRLKKFKLKITHNHHNEPLRKRQKLSISDVNINDKPVTTQHPKPKPKAPPKPPPPKPKGPSKYETVANLDPSNLASIGGTDGTFATAVFNKPNPNETIINIDGSEYKMNENILREKVSDRLMQKQKDEDLDVDLKRESDISEQLDIEANYKNITITQTMDTKGKRWAKTCNTRP